MQNNNNFINMLYKIVAFLKKVCYNSQVVKEKNRREE